ncbi:MAG: UPF0176 protein [Candidatus Azotimanducaceae bacterium]|jgi:UPF0176 protein|tara:strand:+ start:409 stop:1428 length:1020 start_codon:yes stop_codon:yes gene_type:complete
MPHDTGDAEHYVVSAFYIFARIESPETLRKTLLRLVGRFNILGTILVAPEGINGTVAGFRDQTDQLFAAIREDPRLSNLQTKESCCAEAPFLRAKVKLKKEIVTMGQPDLDPVNQAGTYVAPEDWNALIQDPSVMLIDTRNDYEVEVGTFQGALNPETQSFSDFPDYAARTLPENKAQKIAMFCTGGIRCEKSTAYLKSQGYAEVYHLEGGILKYLETVPKTESLWQGACFVFDERVAVDHQLQPAGYVQCHACRRPLTDADLTLASYKRGLSCRHCIGQLTPHQQARFAEREKQVHLAKARGDAHIGDAARKDQQNRKARKVALKASQSAQPARSRTP